ncbi:hypothetical protein EDB85DRAFT_1871991 [Lactarius pseudohatsudake]|nr:hypothetical protein EDB85DRAFT_1871991 [Lactarius pseudohatsudake]
MSKPLPGPSRLSKILQNLNRAPRPTLTGVKSITLTLAQRNDQFGARHFLKEEMPRIQYANPKIDIQVNKLPKAKEEAWKPGACAGILFVLVHYPFFALLDVPRVLLP